MNQDPVAIMAVVVAIGGSVLAWLLSDARGKGRSDAQSEKIERIEHSLAETQRTMEMLHRAIIAADSDRKWLIESIKEMRGDSGSFSRIPKTGV